MSVAEKLRVSYYQHLRRVLVVELVPGVCTGLWSITPSVRSAVYAGCTAQRMLLIGLRIRMSGLITIIVRDAEYAQTYAP